MNRWMAESHNKRQQALLILNEVHYAAVSAIRSWNDGAYAAAVD